MAKRQSGGRAGRIAMRQAPIQRHLPAAPGQVGGQYKPLNEKELQDILDAAFEILEDIGMSEVPDVVMEKALEQGCHINELGRLSYPRAFVEDIIDGACKSFTFHGRNPKHDIEVGGDKVWFGTGGAILMLR